MKRTLVSAATAAFALSGGAALASAPPDSTPAPGTDGSVATVYDDDGNPIVTISVGATETGWTDYDPEDEPEDGDEYLRLTVTIANGDDEDSFSVAVDQFVLQDGHGSLGPAMSVRTAAETESDAEVVSEADLEPGESIDLALTFQYSAIAGPESVFYRSDEDHLTDIAEFVPAAGDASEVTEGSVMSIESAPATTGG